MLSRYMLASCGWTHNMKLAHGLKFRDMPCNSGRLIRQLIRISLCAVVIPWAGPACHSQTTPELFSFFQKNIGLTGDQIASIGNGNAVAKALPSRGPGEIFLFGAVHVDAAPENYLQTARNLSRRRMPSTYIGLGIVNNPPTSSDF